MKKMLSFALIIMMLVSAFPAAQVYATDGVTVEIDGSVIEFDVNPEIKDGHTMVPLRKIFESIGALVKWNNDTQTVSARKSSKTVTLVIGSDAMQLDKGKTDDDGNPIVETIALDFPACVTNGRTLVPVRAISESFGLDVSWDEEKRKVTIVSDDVEDDSWKDNRTSVNLTDLSFNGKGVEISGHDILITSGGDYTLSGTLADGSITVSAKEKVKLRLSGASVISGGKPCIFIKEADKAYITLSKGTENSLKANDSDDGAIYSKENLEIKGEGSLSIETMGGHGIKASDNLTIEEGNITINATTDGIHINDTFKMTGGTLNITSVGDGIDSESIVNISGGEINVKTNGVPLETSKNENSDVSSTRRPMFEEDVEIEFEKSTKGINAEWMMCISNGIININSASHSVHCEDEIEINNSVLRLNSEYEKGISAHGNLTVNGAGTLIDIAKSTEGIESKNVMTINDGVINIIASDDAINATGGKSGTMMGMGPAGWGNGGNRQASKNPGNNIPPKRDISVNSSADKNLSNRQLPDMGRFMPPFGIPSDGQFVPPFEMPSDGYVAPPFGMNHGERFIPSDGSWRKNWFIPSDGSRPDMNHTPEGFRGGMRSDSKDCLIINGGVFDLYSGDDGLDSNGNLVINGGTIKAGKSNGSFYGAFGIVDPDGQLSMSNKATVIFTASSGNERSLKLTQNTILIYCSKNHQANEKVAVSDSAGKLIYDYESKGSFSTVLIASPDLKNNEEYEIVAGDEIFNVKIGQQLTTVGTVPVSNNRFGRGTF